MEDKEIFEKIVQGQQHTEEYEFETDYGDVTFTVTPLNRRQRFHFMSQLPEGIIRRMEGEADDDEPLSKDDIPDAGTIDAMEGACAASLRHDEWAPEEIEMLIQHFTDEALFDAVGKIMEISDDVGSIRGFRE